MLDLMTPLEIFLTFYAVVITIFALVVVLAPGNIIAEEAPALRKQIEKEAHHV